MSEARNLSILNKKIIACRKCPRLVEFRERVAKEKRKQFSDFKYWGKPVPGYGDPNARFVVVGLAPAAHGGNRTGRVFTGDNSARFLVRHLYEVGFANQPTSETRDDGLKYTDCYVTAVVRCVPPNDKPLRTEMLSCAPYIETELNLLTNSKAILALGKIAFDSVVSFYKRYYGVKGVFRFKHGKKYVLSERLPTIFASYHPSPRNTNTGKLTGEMFSDLLSKMKRSVDRLQS